LPRARRARIPAPGRAGACQGVPVASAVRTQRDPLGLAHALPPAEPQLPAARALPPALPARSLRAARRHARARRVGAGGARDAQPAPGGRRRAPALPGPAADDAAAAAAGRRGARAPGRWRAGRDVMSAAALPVQAPIFVAGHRGMVGSALVRALQARGHKHIVTRSRDQLDLCDAAAVDAFLAEQRPAYVFVAAAKVGGILANQ